VSGSPAYTTSATSTSDPGSFTLTPAQGTLAIASSVAGNYTFSTWTPGTITITKAGQTIGYAAPSKINYGDSPTVTASVNSNTTNASSGLALTVTTTGELSSLSNVGSTYSFSVNGAGAGTITLTQAGNKDYAAATLTLPSFTIGQLSCPLWPLLR